MPYIGNTIRAADDYRLIDDISSGFNGSATSFALQVAGSAPVPFPKSPQQILVSVNGVIQEPDPTGASGFNLVGTNIVFSSAPTNGHAFFGIIYATADYLNAGGNFPSGSTGAPSLTFIGDEDTGIYRKGSGSVGFVSNSTEIANTDSNGITISSGDLILGDNRKAKFGASADLQIYHGGTNSIIQNSTGDLYFKNTNNLFIQVNDTEAAIYARPNGAVELYHDNVKKLETASNGVTLNDGLLLDNATNAGRDVQWQPANDRLAFLDNTRATFGDSVDLQIYHDSTNSYISNTTGDLFINCLTGTSDDIFLQASDNIFIKPASGEDGIKVLSNGAVELYYDNSKKFETTSTGAVLTGNLSTTGSISSGGNISLVDTGAVILGTSNDCTLSHSGTNTIIDNNTGDLILRCDGDDVKILAEDDIVLRDNDDSTNFVNCINGGAVELYHNGTKKFETTSYGTFTSGTHALSGNLDIANDTGRVKLGTGADLQIYHNGSDSYIEDSGTGVLVVKSNTVSIRNAADNEQLAKFIENSSVELYHDNSKKLETTSTGATITGEGRLTSHLVMNTVDSQTIYMGAGNDLTIRHDGSNGIIDTSTGSLKFIAANDVEAIKIFNDGTVNIGATADNIKLRFGIGSDLQIYHDGSNSYIANTTGTLLLQNSGQTTVKGSTVQFENAAGSEVLLKAIQNGQVELYYDNSKKFETNANGVSVVGTTGSNPTIGINHSDADVTGEVVRFKRTDLPTIRYHSIMAQHAGGASGNFIDFKLHNGSTTTAQSSILKLFGSGLVHVDDNIKLDIGTGSDLHIYHDGTSSVIKNTTGDLYVQSIEDVKLRTNDSEIAVDCVVNDAVKLYYDTSLKLETTSTGSKTTGMHLIRGESDIDNQGSPLLFLQSNANTNVKAVFLLEDDYTSGRAMLAINVGESGVTNDRDLVLQKAGGRVGLRGTPTVPVHIHGTTQIEATTTIQGGFTVRKASHSSYPYVNIDGNSGSADFYRQTTAGGIVHFFSDVGGTRTMKSYINENGVLTSTSDYRLKTDISEITNGISLVKNLKPSTYKFTHDSSTTHHGFIAHELQEVLPNCVDGDKDAVKEDGTTPDYQFYSDQELVPVLTAALKEAITKIETLETKVAALEAA